MPRCGDPSNHCQALNGTHVFQRCLRPQPIKLSLINQDWMTENFHGHVTPNERTPNWPEPSSLRVVEMAVGGHQ